MAEFHFAAFISGICVTTLEDAQTETVLFLQTVTERRLIMEMRYMFLYSHSDADLLCVITVKSVCRKMFEIVLSKLVEKHYPPQKCEKQQ